jgi:hypothetical protein
MAFRFCLLQQNLPAVLLFPPFGGTFRDGVSFRLRCARGSLPTDPLPFQLTYTSKAFNRYPSDLSAFCLPIGSRLLPLGGFARNGGTNCLSANERASLGADDTFQSSTAWRYRPIGSAIPFRRFDDLMVFPPRLSDREVNSRPRTLLGFRSPSKFVPFLLGREPLGSQPLSEACTPWHIRVQRSGSRGLCLPATFRPQGLTSLTAACSL